MLRRFHIPFLMACAVLSASPAALADDAQQRRDGVDPTQPVGTNPITKFETVYLGQQVANNSCSHRDLGFTGELQGKWYAVFGDTLWCAQPLTDPSQDNASEFHGMVRDSLSLTTDDPLLVVDLHLNDDSPVRHQQQFVPFNASWGEDNTYGFGGTSLVETANGAGAVFYLVNANSAGLKGAGVAKVELVSGVPTVTKRFGAQGYWWPASSTPRYGDVAAFRDPRSEYIYAWGGAPTSVTDFTGAQYVYLLRVRAADAYDLAKYEYWWGAADGGWKTGEPLTQFGAENAVMWFVGQGQFVWSEFWGVYVFVHLSPGGSDVLLRTATALEGPWTPDVKVYTATPIDGGLTYAGVAHPYLDASGRTLTISFTNNNHIEVIKVTFSK
ncbi:uncharacterized protein F4807DRAFT_156496 [Annulohypoxylon truncatum]|uniref:uncharacterized protein n=1 Tax=Annulohypoxylon truncatum TaxID=327061 RepID=UPI002007275B|nr:uncharacterized protein F4807DRAFT_156496 [Annulohypoxylon truncatum]KAI1208215.1 hypothetical protein F4807DRAFT_156496 [Annulohypoxylon truncatum]